MSPERHLHIADEYDQIAATVLAEASLAAKKSLEKPFPSTNPFEKSRIFSEKEFFTDLIEVGDDPEALELFNNKYDNAQIVNRPVLKSSLAEPKWGEQLTEDTETAVAGTPKVDFRKEIRAMLLVPDGEDSIEFFKGVPWNTWLEMKRAGYFTREAFESIGQQVDLDPKTIVRAAAVAVTAAGVIAVGVSNSGLGRTEQAIGPDGVIDTELIVSRSKDKASVPFSLDNQEIAKSEKAAEELLGVAAPDVVIKGDEIEFSGKAEQATDEELIAATMEAQRPDVAALEITPEPKVQEQKFPTTPEEKFSAEIVAIESALKHAIETGGDLGPLNHMVAHSPIFQPRYDLPGDLENGTIRALPPSNLLNIDGLKYEFSQGAPDKERMATTTTVALTLATAYAYNQSISANPEYSDKYGDSCIRVGDLSARDGHVSHYSSQVDITSSIKCDVIEGHEISSGPVFWINRTEGGIDQNITNPNHDNDLDNLMLQFMTSTNINGQPVVGKILYSKPDSPERVSAYANHSNHIHVNAAPPLKDLELKEFADGGERPERNLDQLRGQIFSDYDAGVGVEGISKQPSTESQNGSLDSFSQREELNAEVISMIDGLDIEQDKKEFLKIMLPAVLNVVSSGAKMSPEVVIAQAVLESNWGKSGLSAQANNYFGIKAGSSWNGRVYVANTKEEYTPGSISEIRDAFRAYDTPTQSIDDYAHVIGNLEFYHDAMRNFSSPEGYVRGLIHEIDDSGNIVKHQGSPGVSSYATDTKYEEKVIGIINDLGLREIVAKEIGSRQIISVDHTDQQILNDLVLTGDSLTVGLDENHANIAEMDTEFGINVVGLNARGGRALSNGEDNGMDSIEGLIASGAINQELEAVYLAYGTNYEKAEQFETNLRKAITRIGEVSNAQIVMPLIFSQVDHAASRNEIINRVAKETGAKVINPGEGLPLGDGLHPGPDGYEEMAKRILKEVSEMDFTPEPLNPAPASQPAAPAEPVDTTPEEASELNEEQDSADITTTTQVEETNNTESTEESASKEDEIWFTEQNARNVYEVWFTEKIESDNGELVTRVDEEALNKWMANNVPSEERNGQTVYHIDFYNVPTELAGAN